LRLFLYVCDKISRKEKMPNPIEEVMHELNQRAASAKGLNDISDEGLITGLTNDHIRLLLVGTGVELEDLIEVAENQSTALIYMIAATGAPPAMAMAGMFFQAFLAGMRFHEKQQQNK
jgi:hypothetical protein